MKARNYTALNPLLRKSHVHLVKPENVGKLIDDGIDEFYIIDDSNMEEEEKPLSGGSSP